MGLSVAKDELYYIYLSTPRAERAAPSSSHRSRTIEGAAVGKQENRSEEGARAVVKSNMSDLVLLCP